MVDFLSVHPLLDAGYFKKYVHVIDGFQINFQVHRCLSEYFFTCHWRICESWNNFSAANTKFMFNSLKQGITQI